MIFIGGYQLPRVYLRNCNWHSRIQRPIGLHCPFPTRHPPYTIVTLVVASSEVTDIPSSIAIVVMIGVVRLINYSMLPSSDKVVSY